MPEGSAVSRTFHIAIADGQAKTRAIPVQQSNIAAFNAYANTAVGRTQHYRLTEKVTLPTPAANQSNWTPIGTDDAPFTGSFDGGGFELTLRGSQMAYRGLFGYMSDAVIENLGLEDVSVISVGGACIGGMVGHSTRSTVRNCYVTGSVALNPSVRSGLTPYVGRVLGGSISIDDSSQHLYARSDMSVGYAYTPSAPIGYQGQSTSAHNTETFWKTTLGWDFNTVWQWGSHNRPILKNVGGPQ